MKTKNVLYWLTIVFPIMILFIVVSLVLPDNGVTQSSKAWTRWGYDFEETHYYPFPTSYEVNLSSFQLKWTKPHRAWEVLTGDVDGDGFLDVVISDGSALRVYGKDGEEKLSVMTDARLNLLADVAGDDRLEIFLSKKISSSQASTYVYNGAGNIIKTLTGPVGSDGQFFVREVSDIDQDGYPEVAVYTSAHYSRNPRGIYLFDYLTGNIQYLYRVGPSGPGYGIVAGGDLDEDGKVEFVLGGCSVHNGGSGAGVNNSATLTTDGDIYSIVFNAEDGSELFTRNYFADGQSNGTVDHAIVDLDHDGDRHILAFEGHSHYYPGTLQVHLMDETGSVLRTWNGPYVSSVDAHFASWSVADLNNDGFDEIFVSFSNINKAWILDHNLTQLTEKTFGNALNTYIYYHVVNDINGDGENEILAGDCVSDRLQVLDSELNELWSYSVNGYPNKIVVSDLDNNGINEIIVAADHLYVLSIPHIVLAEGAIDIDPDTLNLKSKGKWITAYIELPEENNVNDIEIDTMRLHYNEDSVDAAWGEIQGIVQMVKFDRESVKALFNGVSGYIEFRITGKVGETTFEGSDTIRVIIE